MPKPVRRVVTGHDESGKAIVLIDGAAPNQRVRQATGMVSIQLGVDIGTALLRLRARAYADGRLLSEVAADVVARTLHLDEREQQ